MELTNEQINEIKAKYPQQLNVIYDYKGMLGTLAYYDNRDVKEVKEFCDKNNLEYSTTEKLFIPLARVNEFIDNDKLDWEVGIDYYPEDAWDGMEIALGDIICPENKQGIDYNIWIDKDILQQDTIERELYVTTNRYYSWTSKRSEIIDSISYRSGRDYYGNYTITPEQASELKAKWEQIVKEVIDENGGSCQFVEDGYPTEHLEFETLLDEAGVSVEPKVYTEN